MGAVAGHEVDSSHPLWLLLTTGLPHGILLLLSYRQYTVLRSLLEPEERIWTAGLALALIVLSGSAMVHAVRCWVRRKPLEPLPTLVFLGAVVPLLYLFSFLFFREVWGRVEEWMFSPLDYYLLVLSLTLPSLVYGLVLAVSWRLTRAKTKSAWRTFLGAVLIPGAYYLFFQALLPVLRRGLYPQLTVHAVAVTAIVAAVVFFFLLLRGLQLLIAGRREKLARYEPIWRVVFGLVLPMAGLVFYNHGGLFFGRHWPGEIFGRFASPWYYILTSLEGIVLIVPGPGGGTGRRILSTGRLIMLPFSAYFFLVFLPFTPVALLFVIAGGFGFLILSPILLFIVHGVQVARDFRVGRRSPILALAALLVIPGAVSAGFLVQRIRLRETLDYVYAPEYGRSERAPLSAAAIGPILDGIERQKHSSRGTPILTPFYRWLVLDNMTLSDARLAQLRRLFLGTSTDRPEDRRLTVPGENGAGVGIGIHRVAARSEYDAGKRFWVSRIDLEILNRGERQNEFCTSFRLPEGAFLSRYHLDVGDRRRRAW